eukprot:365925-Chlamydomonas_euryale.AAC.6
MLLGILHLACTLSTGTVWGKRATAAVLDIVLRYGRCGSQQDAGIWLDEMVQIHPGVHDDKAPALLRARGSQHAFVHCARRVQACVSGVCRLSKTSQGCGSEMCVM